MSNRIEARAQELVHSAVADGRISATRKAFWLAQLSQPNDIQRTRAEEVLAELAVGVSPADWVV